jgi:hypothetical protein
VAEVIAVANGGVHRAGRWELTNTGQATPKGGHELYELICQRERHWVGFLDRDGR